MGAGRLGGKVGQNTMTEQHQEYGAKASPSLGCRLNLLEGDGHGSQATVSNRADFTVRRGCRLLFSREDRLCAQNARRQWGLWHNELG